MACPHRVLSCLALLALAALAQAGTLSIDALQAARTHGNARVLVMLRDPAPHATPMRQRAHLVAAAVDSLLQRMPPTRALRRRFALVPAVALQADASILQRLRDDPAVLRIDLDAPGGAHAIAPDAASVLNAVSPLQGMGDDGRGMTVAVIDSGVDTTHPDLLPRLVDQQCFCSAASGSGGCCPNAQATQSGAGSAQDANGHGTNVAGIVVGQGNVAPRGAVPAAQLVAVRVMDAQNRFCCTSDIVAALDWVASHHPGVAAVNMSLGTDTLLAGDCDNASANTQALASAINALVANGTVVTASTGNQGSSTASAAPACVRNATGVAATWDFSGGAQTFLGCTDSSTTPRKPTCFSNRSATTDLYAAGAYVTSTGLGGGASTYGGTSQAAPMVAACAVALRQAVPASTPTRRVDAMRRSTTRVTDPVSGRSYPFLDCVGALHMLATRKVRADFDGDGRSDVPWRNRRSGADTIWRSADNATQLAVTGVDNLDWHVVGVGDFDGDGKADLLWRNQADGRNTIWLSANGNTQQAVATVDNLAWSVAGVGDFDGDGRDDILWRNASTGANVIWFDADATQQAALATVDNFAWRIVGIGDFDGDSLADIAWRNESTGANTLWLGGSASRQQPLTTIDNLSWRIVAVGDFDGDGHADLFWHNGANGANVVWLAASSSNQLREAPVNNIDWDVVATGDYDGDGRDDLLWHNAATGANTIWLGASAATQQAMATVTNRDWQIVP